MLNGVLTVKMAGRMTAFNAQAMERASTFRWTDDAVSGATKERLLSERCGRGPTGYGRGQHGEVDRDRGQLVRPVEQCHHDQ